ncbi:DNA polymerase III, delta subunit [Paenibacillus aquistagni]|uniref:DNA polymerase III subunit delta n=1 Tax=Paenibacillus aquistagni TaxID=1852522 RepID=A0A1X7ICP1_9BACL|nr:DNA polymerase III, delta subunit [Paenibacillus aquistagni]
MSFNPFVFMKKFVIMKGVQLKEVPLVDVKDALKEIKRGEPRSLYVLYGTEKYRLQEFVSELINRTVPEENRDLAITKMDTSETAIEQVVEEAETMPFLVERKLILVKDQTIFASGKDKMEHRVDRLLKYMESPLESSILVFLIQADKLDERKKTVKAAKAAGGVLSFLPFGAEELMQWVRKEAEKRSSPMDQEAIQTLLNNAGTNLQTLVVEIEKLSLYAGQGQAINSEMVDQLISRTTEQNVFRLVEDVINGKVDSALSMLYELLKQKEEPIKILALIIRQIRIMLQVKELTGRSFSQQQAASQLGLHPYAVKLAAEQARKHDSKALAKWLSEAADLDYAMKTGRVEKTLGLELLMMKMAAR